MAYTVNTRQYPVQLLRLRIPVEQVGIHHVKVGIKHNHIRLLVKSLTHIRDTSPQHVTCLSIHVTETLTLVQRKFQMLLVHGTLQPRRIRKHYLHVVISPLGTVYHHPIQHTRLHVFMLYEYVVSGNTVIEDTLRNLQFRRLLLHTPQQRSQLTCCLRLNPVLEIETHTTDYHRHRHHRTQNTHQRNTSRFHTQQLQFLAHVTETYQRSQ